MGLRNSSWVWLLPTTNVRWPRPGGAGKTGQVGEGTQYPDTTTGQECHVITGREFTGYWSWFSRVKITFIWSPSYSSFIALSRHYLLWEAFPDPVFHSPLAWLRGFCVPSAPPTIPHCDLCEPWFKMRSLRPGSIVFVQISTSEPCTMPGTKQIPSPCLLND